MSFQNEELGKFLEEIGEEYAKYHYRIESPLAVEEEALIGASKVIQITIPIRNGHGSAKSPKTVTAWVTIDGNFMIEAPSEGTWHIVAKANGKTIFDKSGVKKGSPVHFRVKTEFTTELSVTADWSIKKNTNLEVKIHANY